MNPLSPIGKTRCVVENNKGAKCYMVLMHSIGALMIRNSVSINCPFVSQNFDTITIIQ